MRTIKTNANQILVIRKYFQPVTIKREYAYKQKTLKRSLYVTDSTSPIYDRSLWCKVDGAWHEVTPTDTGYILSIGGRIAAEVINR